MNIIYNSTNLAEKILGKQKSDLKVIYRISNFVVKMEIESDLILYNNFTKKMVLVSNVERMLLTNTPIVYDKNLQGLIENWFLVPLEYDEIKVCEQIFELNKLQEDNSFINNYVILTTTDCNARCFYCYEHGVTRTNMSEQTAKDIVEYIERKSSGNPVTIKWFGGEPLFNLHAIDVICNGLRMKKIEFASYMTTNAYLFTNEVIEKAKNNWNIKRVQITLDGTEKIYNNVKAYIYNNIESPFKIVTDNIEKLLKENICISIRINMPQGTKKDVYDLINYIDNRYFDKDNLSVYVANLFDPERIRSDFEIIKMYDEYFQIDKYLVEKKLRKYKIENWSNLKRGCMAQNVKSVVITPMGLLGKCEHYSEGEKLFGSIYNDDINISAVNYWYQHKRSEACNTCVAYPNCYGEGNCPSITLKCEIAEKKLKIYNLKMSILAKYNEYKQQKNT